MEDGRARRLVPCPIKVVAFCATCNHSVCPHHHNLVLSGGRVISRCFHCSDKPVMPTRLPPRTPPPAPADAVLDDDPGMHLPEAAPPIYVGSDSEDSTTSSEEGFPPLQGDESNLCKSCHNSDSMSMPVQTCDVSHLQQALSQDTSGCFSDRLATPDLELSQPKQASQAGVQLLEAARLAAIDPVILAIQFNETLLKLEASEVDVNRLALPAVPPPFVINVDNPKQPKCFVVVQPLSELLEAQADTIALLCDRLDTYQEQLVNKPFKLQDADTSQLRADADNFVPSLANNFPKQPSSEPVPVANKKDSFMRSQPTSAKIADSSQLLADGDRSPQERMKRYSFRRSSALLSPEPSGLPSSLAPSAYATDHAGECRQQ